MSDNLRFIPLTDEKGTISGADRPAGPLQHTHLGQSSLLVTLENLLAIETLDEKAALTEASNLVAITLRADKIDIFLYDSGLDALIAMGVSQTPLGRRQQELGLDRLSIKNGGRSVLVYQAQQPFLTGHADEDLEQLVGVVEDLGLHSVMSVPLYVKGKLRGLLEASAVMPEAFSEYDLRFLEAVSSWIGTILHRTELTNQLFQEAQAEARRATAEELVTIIAHDLRNYFTPLKVRLALLHNRAVNEARELDLEDITGLEMVMGNLNSMVSDLLDVGRLEQGPFFLDKKPLELVSLVKEVASVFNSAANPVVVHSITELYLEADARRLRQVLENLLANALKYSPPGAGIAIALNAVESELGWLANLTITDKGPEITPKILADLFQRFVKTSGSAGLGLGLYLSRQIAQAHGGTLTAVSSPENGTVFLLSLPVS